MANRAHKKRPRDPNQLGKIIVDISVGDIEDRAPTPQEQGKDPAAVKRGQLGGRIGGRVRAANLSKKRRVEIAKKAAKRRWKAPADSE